VNSTHGGLAMKYKLGIITVYYFILAACSSGSSGTGEPSGSGATLVYDTLLPADVTTLRSIAAYDINADGNMDILAYRYDLPSSSQLYFGNGNGTFTDKGSAFIGGAQSVAFADLDKDTIPDIVVGTHDSVGVYHGMGDGTFTGVGGAFLLADQYSLVIDDFNHDTNLDIAATHQAYPNGLSVLLGNGNGTLKADVHYNAGDSTSSMTKADFNKDGNIDLAVTGIYTAAIYVLLGNSDGTFKPATLISTGDGSAATQNRSIASGDLDGDTNIDLVVGKMFGKQFSVLINDGAGNFTLSNVATTNITAKVVIADMDGDDIEDVVSADPSFSANVYIHRGNGDGTFVNDYTLNTTSTLSDFTVADFNRDGKKDIAAVVNRTDGVVAVYMNGGAYTY